jgi:hypothetical protein
MLSLLPKRGQTKDLTLTIKDFFPFELQISPQIRNDPNGILRGLGELLQEKTEVKNLVALSLLIAISFH